MFLSMSQFAISIVNSGCYQDDDDKGEQLIYTGAKGCLLLFDSCSKKLASFACKQFYLRAPNKHLLTCVHASGQGKEGATCWATRSRCQIRS